jgi:hypothetical protein
MSRYRPAVSEFFVEAMFAPSPFSVLSQAQSMLNHKIPDFQSTEIAPVTVLLQRLSPQRIVCARLQAKVNGSTNILTICSDLRF